MRTPFAEPPLGVREGCLVPGPTAAPPGVLHDVVDDLPDRGVVKDLAADPKTA